MKKRRNSGISVVKDRPQIQKSSDRCSFDRVLSSQICHCSRVSHQTLDMSRVKRVRFADLDTVREINRQPDASSSPAKSSLPRSFDNPKTSEYQYYQKLRQAASSKGHSYLRDKQENHLNDIEASNYMRG
ncbi:uncharacterized protein LOC131245736 [Magnolia sinica]|uniref:uncharacterized protein LOC131245736 n=1 Tax=Magnolia sinica TaxID=86752 RepID=UPI00265889AD|nr:uncharacterized protein LOC131245736 [Magnolia sinica]